MPPPWLECSRARQRRSTLSTSSSISGSTPGLSRLRALSPERHAPALPVHIGPLQGRDFTLPPPAQVGEPGDVLEGSERRAAIRLKRGGSTKPWRTSGGRRHADPERRRRGLPRSARACLDAGGALDPRADGGGGRRSSHNLRSDTSGRATKSIARGGATSRSSQRTGSWRARWKPRGTGGWLSASGSSDRCASAAISLRARSRPVSTSASSTWTCGASGMSPPPPRRNASSSCARSSTTWWCASTARPRARRSPRVAGWGDDRARRTACTHG